MGEEIRLHPLQNPLLPVLLQKQSADPVPELEVSTTVIRNRKVYVGVIHLVRARGIVVLIMVWCVKSRLLWRPLATYPELA